MRKQKAIGSRGTRADCKIKGDLGWLETFLLSGYQFMFGNCNTIDCLNYYNSVYYV